MDPSKNKKALILYASAGLGHEKAAKAVEEAYRRLYPEVSVGCYDVLSFTAPFFGKSYQKTYLFLIKKLPRLWGFLYDFSDQPWVYRAIAPLRRLVNGFFARGLEKLILDADPAVIVSTHFLSTEVAAFLKTRGKVTSRLVTVITDYLPHSFWIQKAVDFYAVGLPDTEEALLKRGIPAERIRVSGIPTARKFSVTRPKNEACAWLGLPENRFTVLMTSGGAGVGSTQKIAEGFKVSRGPLQVVVVCGTNFELFEKLNTLAGNDRSWKILGFVDNMDEWMDACDVVIGKGGGLTIAESLCKGKPMILFESLPGQETRNAACLVRHNACFVASSAEDVLTLVAGVLSDPQKLRLLREAALRIGKPSAAEAVARLAHE